MLSKIAPRIAASSVVFRSMSGHKKPNAAKQIKPLTLPFPQKGTIRRQKKQKQKNHYTGAHLINSVGSNITLSKIFCHYIIVTFGNLSPTEILIYVMVQLRYYRFWRLSFLCWFICQKFHLSRNELYSTRQHNEYNILTSTQQCNSSLHHDSS